MAPKCLETRLSPIDSPTDLPEEPLFCAALFVLPCT